MLVNRRYVNRLGVKEAVVAASTANLTLSGAQTVDGVFLGTSSYRVLVKNQTNPVENGIYVTAAGAWTRPTHADNILDLASSLVWVMEGTTNADTAWYCPTY